MGDSCPRKARTGSPSSFVRQRFARRERGLRHPHPPLRLRCARLLWLLAARTVPRWGCPSLNVPDGGCPRVNSSGPGLIAAHTVPRWVARPLNVPGGGCPRLAVLGCGCPPLDSIRVWWPTSGQLPAPVARRGLLPAGLAGPEGVAGGG
jgi:hypothetical protein